MSTHMEKLDLFVAFRNASSLCVSVTSSLATRRFAEKTRCHLHGQPLSHDFPVTHPAEMS